MQAQYVISIAIIVYSALLAVVMAQEDAVDVDVNSRFLGMLG